MRGERAEALAGRTNGWAGLRGVERVRRKAGLRANGWETGRAGERGWANAGFGVGAGWAARERARGGKGKSGPGWVEFGFGLGWGFPGFWASFPFSSSISFPF